MGTECKSPCNTSPCKYLDATAAVFCCLLHGLRQFEYGVSIIIIIIQPILLMNDCGIRITLAGVFLGKMYVWRTNVTKNGVQNRRNATQQEL